jgi:hypothetical protein
MSIIDYKFEACYAILHQRRVQLEVYSLPLFMFSVLSVLLGPRNLKVHVEWDSFLEDMEYQMGYLQSRRTHDHMLYAPQLQVSRAGPGKTFFLLRVRIVNLKVCG